MLKHFLCLESRTQHIVCRYCRIYGHFIDLLRSGSCENPQRTLCTFRSIGRGEFDGFAKKNLKKSKKIDLYEIEVLFVDSVLYRKSCCCFFVNVNWISLLRLEKNIDNTCGCDCNSNFIVCLQKSHCSYTKASYQNMFNVGVECRFVSQGCMSPTLRKFEI